ncbi:hypothetical protein PG995_005771 [Apiospora arundinis]
MCYNHRVYYDCIENHLQSSRGQVCSTPFQCGCWRRHDPDRLRRLHVLESLSPDLCPRCPPPFAAAGPPHQMMKTNMGQEILPHFQMIQKLGGADRNPPMLWCRNYGSPSGPC